LVSNRGMLNGYFLRLYFGWCLCGSNSYNLCDWSYISFSNNFSHRSCLQLCSVGNLNFFRFFLQHRSCLQLCSVGNLNFFRFFLHKNGVALDGAAVPFLTNSHISTYLHWGFIINRNNHGPSLVPWGTPDGIRPHAFWVTIVGKLHTLFSVHPKVTYPACDRIEGMERLQIFWTKMRWSIRSKAFLHACGLA
jgi:hypothetical protein